MCVNNGGGGVGSGAEVGAGIGARLGAGIGARAGTGMGACASAVSSATFCPLSFLSSLPPSQDDGLLDECVQICSWIQS